MIGDDVVFACVADMAGKTRGKGVPEADLDKAVRRGLGWAPTNMLQTCFDAIADTPFGAVGERYLRPDPATRIRLRDDDTGLREDFVLSDIAYPDGTPWEACPRSALRGALERLSRVSGGLSLLAAFEHEFQVLGREPVPGTAYTLGGFRTHRALAERVVGALRLAGLEPEAILKEYGAHQLEVAVAPRFGVAAADAAIQVREIVRAVAYSCGEAVTFTPLRDPAGVGNGLHIHMSLVGPDGELASYDPDRPHHLSSVAGSFIAGILSRLPEFVALTAPSLISYKRLTPHRWSAPFTNLGLLDREAAVRLCAISEMSDVPPERQFNFEFRAADAAASPYLQLAAIVHAGADGIEQGLATPEATDADLSSLDPAELAARGIVPLPSSLSDALDRLANSEAVASWFPPLLLDLYQRNKAGEIAYLAGKTDAEICMAYEAVY